MASEKDRIRFSAWRTGEHDVRPSDRTRPGLKVISVAAQQLFVFWIVDDLSINSKKQVLFHIKSAFHHSFHPSKCVDE
jgi:hypothetical protein